MMSITQCSSLAEVRDNVDRQLVTLIAEWGALAAMHPPSPTKN